MNTYDLKLKRRSLTTTDETKCDRKDALTIARLVKDGSCKPAGLPQTKPARLALKGIASLGLAGLAILSCICRTTLSRSLRGLL